MVSRFLKHSSRLLVRSRDTIITARQVFECVPDMVPIQCSVLQLYSFPTFFLVHFLLLCKHNQLETKSSAMVFFLQLLVLP